MDPLRRLEEISHKLKELQRLTHESPQLRLRLNDGAALAPVPKGASPSRACSLRYHHQDADLGQAPQPVRALDLSACWANAVQQAQPGRCFTATRAQPAPDLHAGGRKPSLHRVPPARVHRGTAPSRSLKSAAHASTAHNRFRLKEFLQTKQWTKITGGNQRPFQSQCVRPVSTDLHSWHPTLPSCTCPRRTSPCPVPRDAGEADSVASTMTSCRTSPAPVRDPYPRIRAPPHLFAPRYREKQLFGMAKCLLRDTCGLTNQPREHFVLGSRKETAKCTCRVIENSSSDAAAESDQCNLRTKLPTAQLPCPFPDTDDGSQSADQHCNAAVPLRAPQTLAVSAACSATNVSLASAHNQTDQPKQSTCGTLISRSQASVQVSTTSLCRRADTKTAQLSTTSVCQPAGTAAVQVSTSSLCKRAETSVQCSPSRSSSRHLLTVPPARPLSPVCSSHFAVQPGVTASDYSQGALQSSHDSGIGLSAHRSQACQTGGQALCRSQSTSAVNSTVEAAAGKSTCQLPHAKSVQALPTADMSSKSTCTAPVRGQSEKAVAVGQPTAHACTSMQGVTPAPQAKTCTAGTSHANVTLSKSTCTTALNNSNSTGTSHVHLTSAKSTCTKVQSDTNSHVQTVQPAREARSVALGPSIHSVCSTAKHSKSVQLHATCCDNHNNPPAHSPSQTTDRRIQVKRLLTEVASQQSQEREQGTGNLTNPDRFIAQQPSARATAHVPRLAPSSSSQLGRAIDTMPAKNGPPVCASRLEALTANVADPVRADHELHALSSYGHAHSPIRPISTPVSGSQMPLHQSPQPFGLTSHQDRSALLTSSVQPLPGSGHYSSSHYLSPNYAPSLASPLSFGAPTAYPSVHATPGMMNLVDKSSVWPAHNASHLTVTSSAESAVSYFPSATSLFSRTSLSTASVGPLLQATDEDGGSEQMPPACQLNEMSEGAGTEAPKTHDGTETCPIPATTPDFPTEKVLKDVAVCTSSASRLCQESAELDKGESGDGLEACTRRPDGAGHGPTAVEGVSCPGSVRRSCRRRSSARFRAGTVCTAKRTARRRQRDLSSHSINRRHNRHYRSCSPPKSRDRPRAAGYSLPARSSDMSTYGSSPSSSSNPTPATLSPGRLRSEGELVHRHLFRASQLDLVTRDDGQTRRSGDADVDWGRLIDTLVQSAEDVHDGCIPPSLSDSTAVSGSITGHRQKLISARLKRRSTGTRHRYRPCQHGRKVTRWAGLTCQQPCCMQPKRTNHLPSRCRYDQELPTDTDELDDDGGAIPGCRPRPHSRKAQRIPSYPCRPFKSQVKAEPGLERDRIMKDLVRLEEVVQVPTEVGSIGICKPAANYMRTCWKHKEPLPALELSDSGSDFELGQLIMPRTVACGPTQLLTGDTRSHQYRPT